MDNEIKKLEEKLKELKKKNKEKQKKKREKVLMEFGVIFEKNLKEYLKNNNMKIELNSNEILLEKIDKNALDNYYKQFMYAIYKNSLK